MAVIQVWTGPRCQPGAEPLGPVAQITSGRVTEATSGAQGPVLTIPRAVADDIALRAGAWLWISHPRRGVSEWPILTLTTGDGRARDTVSVQGGTIRQAIALRGTIRTVPRFGSVVTAFTLPALTPAEILRTYFFTNLAADNLTWLVPGLVEYSGTIALGSIANWTRGQLLDAIERATGYRFAFTRINDTAYQLDLRDPSAPSTSEVLLTPGVSVDTIEQTEDLVSGATVVEPRTAAGAPLGETWWTVAGITGTGPFWVRLADPAGGPPVLREDGQVTGWWLRPNDGLPVAITDSRASDSAVQVASVEGLVVGGLAALWQTADGAFPAEVPSPSGLAARNRVVQSITVAVPSMLANRVTDGALRNALALWEVVNPSGGAVDILQRSDPKQIPMAANGAVAAGGTSVIVDGGPANAIIRRGDPLAVAGTDVAANASVTTSATGTATVPLGAPLPATLADGTLLAWRRAGVDVGRVTTNGVQSAGASSLALRSLTETPQLTSGDVLVKSAAPSVTISADDGWLNNSQVTIPSGATIQFSQIWFVLGFNRIPWPGFPFFLDVPFYTPTNVSYTGTTTAVAAPGAVVSFTASDSPSFGVDAFPGGPPEGRIALNIPSASWTLSATPAAWDGARRTTATITGTLGQALVTNEILRWTRAGVILGDVVLTANVGSGSSTLPLENPSAFRLLSGDTFSLPSQTLYASAQVVLSGTGTGTIPLRAATVGGVADNAVITVERPRDLADAQFGGPNVLRLRGTATAAPTTYRGGTAFGLYSPILRVQSPNPAQQNGQYSVWVEIGTTSWGAQPAQAARVDFALWDVDTGQRLAFSNNMVVSPAPYDPRYTQSTHSVLTDQSSEALVGPRRLRISLHGGQSDLGGFALVRFVALHVFPVGSPAGSAQVDGAFGNQAWHRAQDLLDATRDTNRYRVTLGSVAPLADDPAQLLTVGGVVRLRSDRLTVDKRFRVARLVWSLKDDDAIELELASLTPRLTDSA